VLGSLNKLDNVFQPDRIGYVLMAQNGSLVRYLPAFNENAFNLIKNLGSSVNFPASEDDPKDGETKADDGTITIKSAWIEIKGASPDPAKFHVRKAWVQDVNSGICTETKVGLVGLHIVHKTNSSQQWIWASFEHVKNAPGKGESPASGFTFNSGNGEAMLDTPPPDAFTPTKATPYNVERLYDIASDIQEVNRVWRKALQGSVWSNYQLVLVQWPGLPHARYDPRTTLFGDNGVLPAPPCFVAEPKANIANTIMETFLQSPPGKSMDDLTCPTAEKNLDHTCIGCHYHAHNYDFIWAIAKERSSGNVTVDAQNRASALSTLRKITGWSSR
jgi:hypothetical protein